jgi:hypothetical protein
LQSSFGSGGQVRVVDSFSDEDEDDCLVYTEQALQRIELKTSGLGYKELFTINMPKIEAIKEGAVYKEGESDNSSENDSDNS